MGENDAIFNKIAEALLVDYSSVYYVNAVTNEYRWYSMDSQFKSLKIEPDGDNFFENVIRDSELVVYKEDIELVRNFLAKENLMKGVRGGEMKSIVYRLNVDGKPVYFTMRLIRGIVDNDDYFIIGVLNVNDKVLHEQEKERLEKQNLIYNRIVRSLAQIYESIYYVDIETGEYTVYAAARRETSFDVINNGTDFFADFEEDVRCNIVPEDRDMIGSIINRETLKNTYDSKTLNTSFRALVKGVVIYMNLMVAWAEDRKNVIIGITNVDKQMRKEIEQTQALRNANERAETDGLTKVKNMSAYQKMEMLLQEDIDRKKTDPFAIVVCDINGLKEVNDSLGHKAGDAYICTACNMICKTFMHSPVYRVGGDEFCVVVKGDDFNNKDYLMKSISETMKTNHKRGGVVVAFGIAVYDPEKDSCVSDVFERADSSMYENKKELKNFTTRN